MTYSVIIERKNGIYRAIIPALANLSAEGDSRDNAIDKVRQAAKLYLSEVEMTTIDLDTPTGQPLRKTSPQAWIEAAGIWGEEDQEALQEYNAEIVALKQRQREAAEREADEAEQAEKEAMEQTQLV